MWQQFNSLPFVLHACPYRPSKVQQKQSPSTSLPRVCSKERAINRENHVRPTCINSQTDRVEHIQMKMSRTACTTYDISVIG